VLAPATFDTNAQLRLALDYAATAEALFGTSDLSPLTTPECTPPPSPTLTPTLKAGFHTNLDIDAAEARINAHAQSTDAIEENLSDQTPSTRPTSQRDRRKARKKSQSHANRSRQRQDARDASSASLKPRIQRRLNTLGASEPLRTEIDSAQSSHINTGFTGLDNRERHKKLYSLEELVGEGSKFGFKLQTWDGR